MAFQQESPITFTLEAAADLSASQYCFVKVTGVQQVNITTAATDFMIGVLQNLPGAVGRAATIQKEGITKMKIGGTVAAGDRLTSDASGRGLTTVTTANKVGAIALQSGAINNIIAVILVPLFVLP